MERPQIGCILMAAGASARFGSDKLAAELGGRSLLRRACEAVPAVRFHRVCIVTARAEGEALAREFGFQLVRNDRPELGASLTVRLGLSALQDCDAALFMTADQPLLRRETVERLLDGGYDDVVLALPNQAAAEEARKLLTGMGIAPARILWRQPLE